MIKKRKSEKELWAMHDVCSKYIFSSQYKAGYLQALKDMNGYCKTTRFKTCVKFCEEILYTWVLRMGTSTSEQMPFKIPLLNDVIDGKWTTADLIPKFYQEETKEETK